MPPEYQIHMCMRGRILLGLGVGLIVLLTWPESGMAKTKDAIYQQCACICQVPGDIIGVLIDFSYTGKFSCGIYNGKTCNDSDPTTGGIRSGKTKYCAPYKPVRTVNFRAPMTDNKGAVLSPVIDEEQPADLDIEMTVPAEYPLFKTWQKKA